jgi:hypothetical protein
LKRRRQFNITTIFFNSGAFLPAKSGQKPGFSGHGRAATAGGGVAARRYAAAPLQSFHIFYKTLFRL